MIALSNDIQVLRQTLRHLYDPVALKRSPLISSLRLPSGDESATSLRLYLIKAIQSLKPTASLPQGSKSWRIYHILAYRFIEQSTQKEVASELGLSVRQLRRLEILALETLADHLAIRQENFPDETQSVNRAPGADEELAFLSKATHNELIVVQPFIENIIHTVEPLFHSLGVRVDFKHPLFRLYVYGQVVSIRQGIINVLSVLAQNIAPGSISLDLKQEEKTICLDITATKESGGQINVDENLVEAARLGDRLLALSSGSLPLESLQILSCSLVLQIYLPPSSQKIVLAMDDNLDALRLVERYLEGSLYHLHSLQDPASLIETAELINPDVFLLDVMLPGIDGWELLERLRVHPDLQKIPVIVSTILPQESLAMALGAAAFLLKPVSQDDLLQTLDNILTKPPAIRSP